MPAGGFLLRRDLPAFVLVGFAVAAFILYRQYGVEPRAFAAACMGSHPSVVCGVRQAVLWLQGERLWGLVALAVGLAAFVTGRFVLAPLALALGAGAVVNFNAGLGLVGAALGLWSWLRLSRRAAGSAGRDRRT